MQMKPFFFSDVISLKQERQLGIKKHVPNWQIKYLNKEILHNHIVFPLCFHLSLLFCYILLLIPNPIFLNQFHKSFYNAIPLFTCLILILSHTSLKTSSDLFFRCFHSTLNYLVPLC